MPRSLGASVADGGVDSSEAGGADRREARRGKEEAAQRSRGGRQRLVHDNSCRALTHMRPARGACGGRRRPTHGRIGGEWRRGG